MFGFRAFRQNSKRLFQFTIAGLLGFCIDASITLILSNFLESLFVARIIAFSLAVSVTFLINSKVSFRNRLTLRKDFLIYVFIQIFGAFINFAVYLIIVSELTQTPVNILTGIFFGSAGALLWNFGALIMYTNRKTSEEHNG